MCGALRCSKHSLCSSWFARGSFSYSHAAWLQAASHTSDTQRDCTQAAANSNLCRLLEALDVKTGLWIPDENEEIKHFVPKADEVYKPVQRRDADGTWGKYLGEFMQDMLRKAHNARAIYSTRRATETSPFDWRGCEFHAIFCHHLVWRAVAGLSGVRL